MTAGTQMPTLFLDGIGDVADRIREVDWSRTALGLRERWPPLLTTVLNIVLGARQPMFIAWGPLRTFLYNDGYRSLLGERHPGAFGQPFFEVWPDCQAEFAPVFEKVFAGQSVMIDDMALHLERRGQPEEAHFSFSYTPVREHSGAVIGLLCACTETTAQIQMERRWHAERRELRRLLQKMPGFAAVLSGPTHVVQYVNDAFVALTGARPFVGNPLRDSLPELAGQGMIGLLDQVFVTGKSFAARALPLQLSGAPDTRFVDLVTEPLSDERGCITGVFAGGYDVTSNQRIADELRASESRLRELTADLGRQVIERSAVGGRFWEISPDLLAVLNPDGYFVRANPAWLHLLGWTEETLCKMSYRELIHPEDLDAAARTFESLKHGTPILRIENRYRSKDGEYFWFTWAAAPLGNHYYSSGRDITAERHQGEQLAARTAERDRVWRHSRDLLVVIGPDGIVRDVNPAWTTILGHPIAEVIGHSFHDFVWPDDKALAEQGLQSAARAKDRGEFENRFRHLDGSPHWISWHTSVEEDLVYAYGRDITTVKRAQSELAQAQDALRQSQKMEAVGQLTGGIAHDFNNLLQAITGSLERLQRQLPGDRIADIDRHLGAAMESANRAAALTHRLLAFSRRQTLDPKPTNLNTFLTRMQGALRHTMGAEVAIEFQGGRHLWDTKVDPSQLENAVVNLCLNARDAMPGGGRLRIETANRRLDEPRSDCALPTGQYVVLSVSDSGTGMTPGVLARVFDPFFTTKPLGRGTGLGLSMVYGFVRQSGGHVRIQSEVGRGTTLQLFFPRHTPQAVRLEPPVRVETPAPGLGETILVVDDEPTVRMLITDVLEEKRYRVLDAADGPSALEILQSDIRIDLLITDVGLPGGMNGRQVADAGRVGRPSLQVLFITGFAENAAVGDGHLDTGMQILTKPFPMARLTAKVHDILAH